METIPLYEDPDVHRRRWFVLGAMCLCLVLVVMSVSSLNVALPTLQEDLRASGTAIQWIVDAYAVIFAGVLLTAGALGDRFGRKGALLAGLGIFAAGALLAGTADSAALVVTGRAVQGFGAAFVMPATLSIITSVFKPHERRQAIAVWAGFAGAGGAIGPIVSGLLLEHYWWGSAILVTLPVVALTFVGIAVLAPRSKDDSATPLDPLGAVLSLVGLTALIFGIIEGADRGWTDGLVLFSFAVAVVVLGAFVAWQRRTPHPMLPLGFFTDRRFTVGSGVITLAFFCMFGFFFLFTLYLQFGRGYSALTAGLSTLPMAVMLVVAAPRSAKLAARFGTGPVVSSGFALIALGFAVMSQISETTPYPVLVAGLVLLGGGMGITAAPSTGSIMSAVPMSKAGVGSAVNDTTRELGGALGIAVLGSIANSAYRARMDVSDLQLPPSAAEAARESPGAALGVARAVGPAGTDLTARAAASITEAFNIASLVTVGVAVLAVVLVWSTLSPAKEQVAADASPLTPAGPPAAPGGQDPDAVPAGPPVGDDRAVGPAPARG